MSVTSPNNGTTTLSIATTAAQMSLARPKPGNKGWAPFAGSSGGFLVAVIFSGILPRPKTSRRTLLRRIACKCSSDGGLFNAADGLGVRWRGGNSGPSNPGTTPGSYTVTVTASSGSDATSISVPLTVQ